MKSKKFKNGRMIQKKIPRKSEKLLNINTKLNQSFLLNILKIKIFFIFTGRKKNWKKKQKGKNENVFNTKKSFILSFTLVFFLLGPLRTCCPGRLEALRQMSIWKGFHCRLPGDLGVTEVARIGRDDVWSPAMRGCLCFPCFWKRNCGYVARLTYIWPPPLKNLTSP